MTKAITTKGLKIVALTALVGFGSQGYAFYCAPIPAPIYPNSITTIVPRSNFTQVKICECIMSLSPLSRAYWYLFCPVMPPVPILPPGYSED